MEQAPCGASDVNESADILRVERLNIEVPMPVIPGIEASLSQVCLL
jgi:hypothetical protein